MDADSFYRTLFILGNGFDRAHGLKTSYSDFKEWLLIHGRSDVIAELQSVFPAQQDDKFLLWSQFEKALTQYDKAAVEGWAWDSLCLAIVEEDGRETVTSGDILDTAISDIVRNSFSAWVNDIEIKGTRIFAFDRCAKFFTFNYTETLERLYSIPVDRILHIHGRAHSNSRIIVGHRTTVDPLSGSFVNNDFRENNSIIQNLVDLADLYKPSEAIIEQNSVFFNSLKGIDAITVFGHSCSDVDRLYFEATAANVRSDAKWLFYYFDERNDLINMKQLIDTIPLNRNLVSFMKTKDFLQSQCDTVNGCG